MKLTCFETVELSDVGRKRKNNEDACLRIPEKGVYCVADGMGGVVGGHLASAAIISGMRKVFIESPADEPASFASHVAAFRKAAHGANKWIRDFAEEKVIGQMGSTLVGIIFDPDNPKRAVALHAGDSRLYRYRNGQLQLLTADHTAAAALAAQLGRDESLIPEKFHNELVKAVGLAEKLELEKTLVDVASGDVFLLCSDGLTKMLDEAVISQVIAVNNGADLAQTAKTLITDANEAGGKDNATVILIRLGDLSDFSDVMAPVDLDEPNTSGSSGEEGDTITITKLARAETSQSLPGFTPPTEGGSAHGDTPSEDFSGDTPQTDRGDGPPTPPTVRSKTSLGGHVKKPAPTTTPPRPMPVGLIIGAVIALVVVVGGYFLVHKSSHPAPPTPPVSVPVQAIAPATPTAAQPSTGTLKVKSDPPRAEVYIGNDSVGETPLTLDEPPGQMKVTLKVDGLRDQVATLTVSAGKTNIVNSIFQYGGVIIQSQPGGASVAQNGQIVGYTPYTNTMVAAGKSAWQLAAAGWQTAKVSIDVADHQTRTTMVTLQKSRGVLHLTANFPGVTAQVDGAAIGPLPVNVPVDADTDHTVAAQYKGTVKMTNPVRVQANETNALQFSFIDEPAPAAKWTDHSLGMVFARLPGSDAWAAANRVTLEQFQKVMGAGGGAARETEDDGQRYVVNVSGPTALKFAARATEAARSSGGFPGGAKNYHFALPTSAQWQQMFDHASQLGIEVVNFKKDKEWCRDGNAWSMAGYVTLGANSNPEPGHKSITPPPGDEPRQLAIRLVLAP